jgi:DNA-binding transcriptional ArsR family regulator
MEDAAPLLPLAQALGDPVRLMVLQHLMGGPTTVSELVSVTGSSQSNISNHLGVLRRSKLVRAAKQGRQNVYELRDERVAQLIESLSTLAGAAPRSVRQSPALVKARTCYDHLAGQVGVQLFKVLIAREAITEPETLRTLKNPGSPIELGRRGQEIFGKLGIDVAEVERGRKPYAFGCRDWTEQEPHLGGRLGAALWARFIEMGWVERQAGTRVVLITAEGRRGIEKTFGIAVDA